MKFRKKIAGRILFPLALIFAFAVFAHLRAKQRLRAYEANLASSGEKITIANLTPVLPSSRNGASKVVQINDALMLSEFPPPMMKLIAPGVARVGWNNVDATVTSHDLVFFDAENKPPGTNVWTALRSALAGKESELAEARSTLTNSAIWFPLNYAQGVYQFLPHLSQIRKTSQNLCHATMLDLHERKLGRAMDNLLAAVSVPRIYTNEATFISYSVRSSAELIALNTTWELLQADGWSDVQLAALQKSWSGIDMLCDLDRIVRMERAMSTTSFSKIRNNQSLWPNASGGGLFFFERDRRKTVEMFRSILNRSVCWWLWKFFYSYDDEIANSEFYLETADAVTAAVETKNFRPIIEQQRIYTENYDDGLRGSEPQWTIGLSRMPRPNVARFVINAARAQTLQQMTIAAIALKRYHIKQGRYPERLENLAPDYLAVIPRDHFDGKPLRYNLRPDGDFELYSIGENLTDEGGDPSSESGRLSWYSGRDLMWPRVATPSEIEAAAKKAEKVQQLEDGSRYASPPQ